MISPSSSTLESPPVRGGRTWRLVIGIPLLGLGCLALAAPFLAGKSTAFVLGLLMLASGLIEVVQAIAVRTRREGNDGVGMIVAATRSGDRPGGMLSDGCINVLLGLLIASQWPVSGLWIIGIYVGFRILASGWPKILGRDHSSGVPETEAAGLHPDPRLRLRPHPELAKLRETLIAQDQARDRIDRYWRATLLLTFLAILPRRSGLGVRLQPGALLPELCRGSRRGCGQRGASPTVRGERPTPLARSPGPWPGHSGWRRRPGACGIPHAAAGRRIDAAAVSSAPTPKAQSTNDRHSLTRTRRAQPHETRHPHQESS